MNTRRTPRYLAAALAAFLLTVTVARADYPATVITSGLIRPIGVALSNQGNLIVSETGNATPNSGRLSIVSPSGARRTLISGMPSGIADVGDPSGPDGVFMRGRTLYVAIGIGNVAILGPVPGTQRANPNPLSSPLFSSVLAIHFSAAVEKNTQGFALTMDDQQALATDGRVALKNAAGEQISIEVAVDFPNYVPNPSVPVPDGIRGSNPFDVVVIENMLYATDGGSNLVRWANLDTHEQGVLATFPNIPNPLFGIVGGPFMEAVPTGIREVDGMLLVCLFRGAPFATGQSSVVAIDPATGDWAPFISGLTTAIDVLATPDGYASDYLVLQHASAGPFFSGVGNLLGVDSTGTSKTVLTSGLPFSTSMALNTQTNVLYVTNLGGQLLAIPMGN
jgi:hypothetical protein